MGQRGTKPTPTAQLKLRNSRLVDQRKGEVKPETGIPKPPSILKGAARKEWKYITAELDKLGLVTKVDRALLVSYCEAWAEFLHAWQVVETEGRTYESDKGNLIQSPWVGIKNKAIERIHRMAGHFGLSPSARAGLQVDRNDNKPSALKELLDRKHG